MANPVILVMSCPCLLLNPAALAKALWRLFCSPQASTEPPELATNYHHEQRRALQSQSRDGSIAVAPVIHAGDDVENSLTPWKEKKGAEEEPRRAEDEMSGLICPPGAYRRADVCAPASHSTSAATLPLTCVCARGARGPGEFTGVTLYVTHV
ncbi:hypothetical protein EYF80_015185 [Liparis tanakae]|uniref:Secreted protein n=1 Tax=Liparis tanakae TaxID=230148 RepID=A0A4Z2I9J2_9TELE|nr:hypothetical protein EYF80_015185 [Liparis tanakae]